MERAGADEFMLARLKKPFSGWGLARSGDSERGTSSNAKGGMNPERGAGTSEPLGFACWCRWSPSMWSGSGDGMRARGPGSLCEAWLYEFERTRIAFGGCSRNACWSYVLASGDNVSRSGDVNDKSYSLECPLLDGGYARCSAGSRWPTPHRHCAVAAVAPRRL